MNHCTREPQEFSHRRRSRLIAEERLACVRARRGSNIVASVKPGAGVVTTRGHVHWVVTEFGAVNLFDLTLRQRAEALINIAHPDFRAALGRSFAEARSVVLGAGR